MKSQEGAEEEAYQRRRADQVNSEAQQELQRSKAAAKENMDEVYATLNQHLVYAQTLTELALRLPYLSLPTPTVEDVGAAEEQLYL